MSVKFGKSHHLPIAEEDSFLASTACQNKTPGSCLLGGFGPILNEATDSENLGKVARNVRHVGTARELA